MKKCKIPSLILIFTLLLSVFAPSAAALDNPTVDAYGAVLMSIDGDSETVLYAQNETDLVYPASLTKIMTVLLAVEAIEAGTVGLADPVTAMPGFNFDQIEGGSTVWMGLGEVMPLEDLLYCAMVASANEVCNVIAEYIGGSVAGFVEMMNQRAAELGCTNTHFANTHGLPHPDHYTTTWDFALIAREAVSHDLFMEVCNTVEITIPATNLAAERKLSNTNSLINPDNPLYPGDYLYDGAAGVKTGHTNDAGYCLVSTAERDGVRLLSVIMNAQAYQIDAGNWYYGHFADSTTLYDWAFENFSYQEIVKSTEIVADVPVAMGADTDAVSVRPSTSITAMLPNDVDMSAFTRSITIHSEQTGETLTAPVAAGQILGEITVSRDGVVYGSASLVASTGVEMSRAQYMKGQLAETLRLPAVIITFWLLVLLLTLYLLLVVRYRAKRRAYMRRLANARMAHIPMDDEDEEDEVFETRPQRRAAPEDSSTRPIRATRPVKKPMYMEPDPVEEPTRPIDAPTRVTPVLDSEGEEEVRDYFEEFFGNNKDNKRR